MIQFFFSRLPDTFGLPMVCLFARIFQEFYTIRESWKVWFVKVVRVFLSQINGGAQLENVHSVYLWMEIYQRVEWLRLFRPAWFFASDTCSCSLRRLFVSLSPIADNWSVGPAAGYFWSGLNSFSLSTERMRIVSLFLLFLFTLFPTYEEKTRLSFENSISSFLCVQNLRFFNTGLAIIVLPSHAMKYNAERCLRFFEKFKGI